MCGSIKGSLFGIISFEKIEIARNQTPFDVMNPVIRSIYESIGIRTAIYSSLLN